MIVVSIECKVLRINFKLRFEAKYKTIELWLIFESNF
jgi:hypothetical protein